MKHYIDKATIITEIDKRMQELHPTNTHKMQVGERVDRDTLMWLNALTWVKELVNSLEVKEVDLNKEFDKYCDNLYLIDLENEPYVELFECAKYFFNLGLKLQKRE